MSGHGHDNHVKRRRSRRTHRASGRPYTSPDAGVPGAFMAFRNKAVIYVLGFAILIPVMAIKRGNTALGWTVIGIEVAIVAWIVGLVLYGRRNRRLAAEERAQRRRDRDR